MGPPAVWPQQSYNHNTTWIFYCLLVFSSRHAMCLCHSIINNSSTKQLNGFCTLYRSKTTQLYIMLWNIEKKMVCKRQFIKVETTSKTRAECRKSRKGDLRLFLQKVLSVIICPSQIIRNCELFVFWVTKEWLLFTIERCPALHYWPIRGQLY